MNWGSKVGSSLARRAAGTLLPLLLVACRSDQEVRKEQVPAPPEQAPVPEPAAQPDTTLTGSLTFVVPGEDKKVASLEQLRREFSLEEVESQDPNYSAKKTFFAFPLRPVLEKYVGSLDGARLLLTATDGYSVEVEAERLNQDAYLAVGDRAPGRFELIGDRKVDAGPSYLVWKGEKYSDEKKHPRPWGLVVFEKLDSADRYEYTRPDDGFGEDEAAKKGYELFSASCIRCHSINQQGGKLGPDLNVPQNVLAYRPEDQVRAYIKDPATFRYSSMPAHPAFSEQDLDYLIAYLRLMGEHKHDPHEN